MLALLEEAGADQIPGFLRPEELTWQHEVAAGGILDHCGGVSGVFGGPPVEGGQVGGVIGGQGGRGVGSRGRFVGYRRGGVGRREFRR